MSLPTPLSPVICTVAGLFAAQSAMVSSSVIARLTTTKPGCSCGAAASAEEFDGKIFIGSRIHRRGLVVFHEVAIARGFEHFQGQMRRPIQVGGERQRLRDQIT